MFLSVTCAVIVSALGAACQDQQQTLGPGPVLASVVIDSSLTPAADAYLQAGSGANANFGSDTVLQVMAGPQRTLVRFDQTQIATAIGADSLVSATLQLTIVSIGNWDGSGTLSLHRMARSWTEGGATWNCSIDTNPANQSADCNEAGQWPMGSPGAGDPYLSSATSSITVTNNQTGVVQFDVTADVRAFLAGTTNNGWLIKKDDGYEGFARFRSKETSAKPRLMLNLLQGDTSVPVAPPLNMAALDTTHLAVGLSDTTLVYFRDYVGIMFKQGTSGSTMRAVFSRFSATVVGGLSTGEYVVHVPDPGSTQHALDSLLRVMLTEPSVLYAAPVTHRSGRGVEIHGRYPDDGSGMQRSDWFGNGTDGTRSRLAIRAPLAWGCENGAYDSMPRVGVLDWEFDSTHPDLSGNVLRVARPTSVGPTEAAMKVALNRSHGTQVAGILAARTNNHIGVAGILWRARVGLYAFSRDTALPADPTIYLTSVIDSAIADSVRVLVSSMNFNRLKVVGDTDTTLTSQAIERVRAAIARYVNQGGLFVQAAGNEGRKSTAEYLAGIHDTTRTFSAAIGRIFLAGDPARQRLLLVSGWDQDGVRWDSANTFAGVTEIAAPSTHVLTLAHQAVYGPGATIAATGTSYAAPMVAGAAALVWTLVPSLSASQVKGFLLSDSVVGSEPDSRKAHPRMSDGNSEYLLDVYSSLALAARASGNLPVCGYPVRVTGTSTLRLEAGAVARNVTVSGAVIGGVSVAQGGRKIAVYDMGLDRTIIINHLGQSLGSVSAVQRSYLEEDTLDAVFNAGLGYQTFTIRGDSGTFGADFFAAPLSNLPGADPHMVAVAPDGDHALVSLVEHPHTGCNVAGEPLQIDVVHTYLVTRGGAATELTTAPYCGGFFPVVSAWSHTGRQVFFAYTDDVVGNGTANGTRMRTAKVGQGVTQTTGVAGREVFDATMSADDSLVLTHAGVLPDPGFFTCFDRWNTVATHALVGSETTVSDPVCGLPRQIPNLRVALSGTLAESSRHLDLFAPRVSGIRARSVVLSAQAN